jgi:hypothetical protein
MALVKYNDRSLRNLTTAPAAATSSPGALQHIKTLTASSDSTLSFVNGASDVVLDSTYPIYKFKFISIHAQTNAKSLMVNFSDDTSSHSYDLTKTTTLFYAYHTESGSSTSLAYLTGEDLAQSTAAAEVIREIGNSNDDSGSGEMYLFNPSSTTFVKHFIARASVTQPSLAEDVYSAGYVNTTAAVTAVQFSMASGNIDAGTIELYGIKDA